MPAQMTRSEKFVAWLCERAFLKLWTHPNPTGKKNKELCDCLIVCGPHIIIISVKEIEYRDTGDKVGWERWHKSAIDKSADQIWGAERWLLSADRVSRSDRREISLPPKEQRIFHRVSVSLGANGKVPIFWGDFGNGFIHVLDEYSVNEAFQELDTITDFISYLSASEMMFEKGVRPTFIGGGIADLIALYTRYGPNFGIIQEDESFQKTVIINEGLWDSLIQSKEYKEKHQDLRKSYAWDRLIDHYTEDLLTDGMFDMHSKQITKNELALIAMALQPRGHRANLADAFLEFIGPAGSAIAARVVFAANNTAFVFLGGDSDDREFRSQELYLRCLVVRARVGSFKTIVGIATDKPKRGKSGHSSDILYLHMSSIDEELSKKIDGIQKDLGYFLNTEWPN